jgi:polyisoprenoid-binding protein YceI
MIFDPENPETGLFDVSINTTSINTNSADRDSMMPGQDWFYFESFPSATYLTSQFSTTGPEQYLAIGTLSIKGIERRIDLPFKWTIDNSGIAHMTAETAINRMDFGLGARDWADDDTIGFEVVVKLDLRLTE